MNDHPEAPEPAPNREEAIFEAASKLSGDARAAYLREQCGDDARLRANVESLLQAHEGAGSFLDEAAGPSPKRTIVLTLPPEEKSGDKIGRYKVLQKIGEGGCGVVYMAEQEEPVRRRVALKVIKLGMDTKQVIARFEAERQALAMMDHPNIAKVLDAGATETGRPFFVMELVRGIKITEYCDQNKLSTPERLALFVQVCNAIQHAHQKGIIHRDIKPSNILVTLHDGAAVPKVIDFGIAKATQGRLTDQTLFTAFEQFIGTPAYMSPEQAEMSGLDVDTRCDIYALGVLLYELLTSRTPFDARELLEAGLDGLRRAIREKEPSRPSTRLSTMADADLTVVAQRHQTEPPRLIHLLRGDLDWIVMKTLEKDRTRRYETANALAMDIQRHLNNEAILARPPSNLYRFQKLVRRNRTVFAAVGAGIAALIVGLAFSWYLLIQERAAYRRAVAAEKEQARMHQEAELRAQNGQKIALAGLLVSRGEADKAETIINEVPPSPTVAVIYSVIGYLHARQGIWPKAVSNFTMTVDLEPTDDIYYQGLMPLLAYTGDNEGYHRRCRNMLQRFGATANPKIARRVALNALILPPAAADMETVTKLVNIALADDPDDGDMQFLKALADYRRGDFTNAAEWFQKVKPSSRRSWNRIVAAQMLQAMTQFRLEQIEPARTNLTAGLKNIREKMDQPGKDDLGDHWGEWIITQCLAREARGLFLEADLALGAPSVSQVESEKEPAWQTALRQAGWKFTCNREDDATWNLDIEDQPLTNLDLLRGVQISHLSLSHTKVSDLGPLRGMPLKTLRLAGTRVIDLSPLQGMPLRTLQLSGTKVVDLAPLHDMPLRDLKMTGCTAITNLDALAGIKTFQSVILPPNARGFEFLRELPDLVRIGFRHDPAINGPDRSAAEFWAEFDRTEARKKSAATP